ncbi:MAG: hypothetical protein FJ291_27010 [Planctomycetes bacterium]|nr:hypothetical protein [Planctomycetota bacterium]
MRQRTACGLVLVVTLFAPGLAAAGEFIWVEGEAAKSSTMRRHPWWYDKVKRDQLSGGDFMSNWSDKPGEATYAFAAPAAKEYVFWVRANPVGTRLSYKLDGADWTLADLGKNQSGNANIAEDGKLDLRFIAWVKVGTVKLTQGPHTIAFRMDSANNNHGMLDCFVFAGPTFDPEGVLKPSQLAPVAEATEKGRWAFRPPKDTFSPDALLDLRSLNEKVAGESGFVARSKDGHDFVLGDGRPARFWAVNTGAFNRDLARHARFLAKRGVNMVRFHSNITPTGTDLMGIDTKDRDNLWRGVAAMKREGIYTTYSPYWAGPARVKPAMGVLDTGGNGAWGLDAERWSYSANEVMAVNRYYGGIHEGKYHGWAIVNGDRFTDPSVLLRPRELPIALKQPAGCPMIVSESSWVPPQGYQSEGPFLVAAYQSLNGVDAFYWFATGEEGWRQPGSANGFLPSEGKWVCATPMLMGQWPATALLYRMGYVRQGAPAVHEQRSLDDLWQRRMPIIAEDAGYDPNRDKDYLSKESNVKGGVNPLAHLVGPVVVTYGGDPAKSKVADLVQFIDPSAKTVTSITGEIKWDYGRGLCKLNAPKAQGVTGFLDEVESIALADATISSGNDYATVLLVSMDDKPLATSGRVLVQVGTTERPTGWKTRPAKVGGQDGEEVVDFGRAPWLIVEADVKVTLRNPHLKAATVLDPNGMATRRVPLTEAAGGGKAFAFPPDALYVLLE